MNQNCLKDVADSIQTTEGSIKTCVNNGFIRKTARHPEGKSTPLDKKIYEHLTIHCIGFKEHCKENNIALVS